MVALDGSPRPIAPAALAMKPSPSEPNLGVRFHHVALAVPDLDAAVAWYCEALGLRSLCEPIEIHRAHPTLGEIGADLWGPTWQRCRLAQLSACDGVGLELIEWINPKCGLPDATQWDHIGVRHLALLDPDVVGRAAHLVSLGGTQLSQIWELPDGSHVVYCRDPWGTTVLEFSDRDYREIWANRQK